MNVKKTDDLALSRIRIDKWLWAARFFKTRQLAATAIKNGKIKLNGQSTKNATSVIPGDLLSVSSGPYQRQYEVLALSEHRGPAALAQSLYHETAISKDNSEKLKQALAEQPKIDRFKQKPDKRAIRSGRELKRGD